MPSNSGAVHGARYNARLLARQLAARRFGIEPRRPPIVERSHLVDWSPWSWPKRPSSSTSAATSPASRRWTRRPASVDDGTQPLAHVLDDHAGDGVAVTLEADGSGAIYPVLYVRTGGRVVGAPIDPDPLLRYDGPLTRKAIAGAISDLPVAASRSRPHQTRSRAMTSCQSRCEEALAIDVDRQADRQVELGRGARSLESAWISIRVSAPSGRSTSRSCQR